jgi:hypothetical protein
MKPEETWLGVGAKVGGQFLARGRETTIGKIYNLGNLRYNHWFSIKNKRLGLGLGGGADANVICVFKSRSLNWLYSGQQTSDWGVNISLGKQWSDLVKLLSPKYLKILEFMAKNVDSLSNIDDLRDIGSFLYSTIDFSTTKAEHPILNFDIPLAGGGVELSAFVTRGEIQITDSNPAAKAPTKFPTKGRMAP